MRMIFRASTLLVLTTCMPLLAHADEFQANTTVTAVVTRIVDGDTLHAKCQDGRQVVVHLHAVDAPEKGQAFGPAATNATRQLLKGKSVSIRIRAILKSGDLSADVDLPSPTPTLPPERANTTLVKRGLAWHDTTAKPKVDWLADYQRRARLKRLGLWGEAKTPIPPWQWRKQNPAAK